MKREPVLAAKPTVVIYTHSLMAGSMTFIQSHAEALHRHSAVYAGAHRVNGLSLPPDRTVCANEGGLLGITREVSFRFLRFAPGLVRRLRRWNPVAVHAHFGECGPAGLVLAKSLGVPLLVTFHGRDATITDEENSKSWRGREYLRGRAELIDSAACVIAVSDFIRNKIIQQGFRRAQVVTHYNGIDTRQYTPTITEREPFVLFVGRFVEKKGCYYLLNALSKLHARCNVRAVLIGDGPLRAVLESYARAESIRAEFPGFVAPAQVRDWMNRAAVVVVPSVTGRDGDCEGLPTVVLEAQAMATPVIATKHSGIPEGVIDGETAVLVPERDSTQLSEAIAELLGDSDRARKMGEAGRRFVQRRFSIDTQISGLEDIYERIRTAKSPAQRVA